MVPVRLVTCHVVPVAEEYCTDHPARLTGDALRLYSSTKSFLYVDPELPPPPYIWLTTTEVLPAASRDAAEANNSMKLVRSRRANLFPIFSPVRTRIRYGNTPHREGAFQLCN